MKRVALVAALALLLLSGLIVILGALVDPRARGESPERLTRDYFASLEARDSEAALQAIRPSDRDRSRRFVENLVGNEYRVLGVAVRYPSFLGRLRGEPASPRDVTVFLDITQAVDGVRWQAGPRVDLIEEEGRLYLARPPLS